MGSFIELNYMLQITKDQGFPNILDLEKHKKKPIELKLLRNKTFRFHDKDGIRIYQLPPVACFLVENRNGSWIYWGLIKILDLHLDYVTKKTSGKYEILSIYSYEQMTQMHSLIDNNYSSNFFIN